MKRYILLLSAHLFVSCADQPTLQQFNAEDLASNAEIQRLQKKFHKAVAEAAYNYDLEGSELEQLHRAMHARSYPPEVLTSAQQIYDDAAQDPEVKAAFACLRQASKASSELHNEALIQLATTITHKFATCRKEHIPQLHEAKRGEPFAYWVAEHKHLRLTPEQKIYYQAWFHAEFILKQNALLFASYARLGAYSFVLGDERISPTVSRITQQLDKDVTQEAEKHSFKSSIAHFFRDGIGSTPNDHLDVDALLESTRKLYEQVCLDPKVYKAYLIAKESSDNITLWEKFFAAWKMKCMRKENLSELKRGKNHKDFLELNAALEFTPELTQQCRALLIVANACSGQLIFNIMKRLPDFYATWARAIILEEDNHGEEPQ